ncbi:MAG: hypothetical protein KC592_00720 [Nitrospira sp.]|nr:hypothetical protein [Nitrospira sp.]
MSTPNQLGSFELANRYDALSKEGDLLKCLVHHISLARFRPTLKKILRRFNRQKEGGSV